MDKKGIFWYLLTVLVLSVLVQIICLAFLKVFYLSYTLLIIPLVGVWVARKMSPSGPTYPAPQVLNVPRLTAIRIAIVVPLLFTMMFALMTLMHLSRPDWTVGNLVAQLPKPKNLPPYILMMYPQLLLGLGFAITIVVGPTIYALALLGQEYGWRGYLLPRLMPMGKWRAYISSGFLWSITFVPLFTFGGRNVTFMLPISLVLAMIVGVILAQVWEKSNHVGLTAICAGAIVIQIFGMWQYLFPMAKSSPLWAGTVSISAIVVFAIVAIYPRLFFGRLKKNKAPAVERETSSRVSPFLDH